MMRAGPIGFLAIILGGWVAARMAIIAMGDDPAALPRRAAAPSQPRIAMTFGGAEADAAEVIPRRASAALARIKPLLPRQPSNASPAIAAVMVRPGADWPQFSAGDAPGPVIQVPVQPTTVLAEAGTTAHGPVANSPAWVATAVPDQPSAPRLTGSFFLYAREGSGTPAGLASASQLGGSQAGGRIAWRAMRHVALAGRFARSLSKGARDAEIAPGIDILPFAKAPLRATVERRISLGRNGRDAWSAYAAGGFYKGDLPAGIELDGYAQAGVVGLKRGDLFADGALRIAYPVALGGEKRLRIGGGGWAAAQPGVARLDLGPRAALSLPVDRATLTLAVDWRLRVAGEARPGSGPALTLATDF